MRRREMGFCEVSNRRGGSWHLPRSEYANVLAAWNKGCQRVLTVDFFGSPITIDFAEVDSVSDNAPDALRLRREDIAADSTDDSLAGGIA